VCGHGIPARYRQVVRLVVGPQRQKADEAEAAHTRHGPRVGRVTGGHGEMHPARNWLNLRG
jgi:hypothetical protein